MKIRSHLVLLAFGAVLPVLVFSAGMTALFWREQRAAFEMRFLERTRAMSVALDAEIERYIGVLEVLGQSPSLQSGDLRRFAAEAERARADQTILTNVVLLNPQGQELINVAQPLGAGMAKIPLPLAALRGVARSGRPAISPLLKNPWEGNYYTVVMSPVWRRDAVHYVLAAVAPESAWLNFLLRYPLAADATMTLLDQDGVIIARTLNNQQWVGRKPAPALYEKSRVSLEGAYRSVGLEGQRFYSAHRRSAKSGWTVATGVPQQGVERIMRELTYTMAAGALGALLLAIWFALILGRRIARPVSALARSARSIRDGGPVPVEDSNAVTEVRAVAQALENARAELQARDAALRESAERFRLLTHLMPGVVWTAGPDGEITFANDRWYAYSGLTPEQNALDWPRLVVHPDDYQRWWENWTQRLRDETEYEIEVRYRRHDGVYRWWLSRAIPIKAPDGKLSSWYGFRMDIHEMKEAKDALRETGEKLRLQAQELEQQLIASGRLVSLGEITASMAHEFNNPLGIIMGFAQDLMTEIDPANPHHRSLEIIEDESKRCQKIIQELLQFARPGNVDFSPADVNSIIEKTLTLMANHFYKQKVETAVRLDGALPKLRADPQQLEQVLINLYLNALDAMPHGGKLTVTSKLDAADGARPAVVVTVSDTGFGIEEKELEKIFQPFFTAKKRSGLGLGLPICERIIKNHGGKIAVESKPNDGTTFKITVPLEQSQTGKTRSTTAAEIG